MNNPLATELTLLTRLIYSNKNQHHAAIWFRRATEVKRWTRKLLQQQQQTTTTTTITLLDQFNNRLLRAYDSIIQNLARTAFMAIGTTFIACYARIHSIINHLKQTTTI